MIFKPCRRTSNLYLNLELCDNAAMTPIRARLTLFAIMAIFLATTGNALFLQERPVAPQIVSAGRVSLDRLGPPVLPVDAKEPRVNIALQRELARLGYATQLQMPVNGLKFAVLAYEFDNGMPLTGEPSDALLKRVLFDPNPAPRGVFADRAEANQRLVAEIQNMLLGLGFMHGTVSGRMDIWTESAVQEFERNRGLHPPAD